MNLIKNTKNYFKDWTLYEKSWLIIFTIIILALSYYWKDSVIGIIASITGIITVVLVAKGKISNYYFGIVNVIAYAYVAWTWKYYGEVMLNILYFLPMQFVGLWLWKKNKSKKSLDEVKVKLLSNKERLLWILISILATIAYGWFLLIIDSNRPFIDSSTTVLSIIAMILMALRYVEQWILWILVDLISIIMWVLVLLSGGNDIAIMIMWTAYLVNAVYGLINWIKLAKERV